MNDCKHEETWSDGDFKFCSDCGEMVAIWTEDDGWVEVTA